LYRTHPPSAEASARDGRRGGRIVRDRLVLEPRKPPLAVAHVAPSPGCGGPWVVPRSWGVSPAAKKWLLRPGGAHSRYRSDRFDDLLRRRRPGDRTSSAHRWCIGSLRWFMRSLLVVPGDPPERDGVRGSRADRRGPDAASDDLVLEARGQPFPLEDRGALTPDSSSPFGNGESRPRELSLWSTVDS